MKKRLIPLIALILTACPANPPANLTPSASPTPTASPTPVPTPVPTATPQPTAEPTTTPSAEPTPTPSPTPWPGIVSSPTPLPVSTTNSMGMNFVRIEAGAFIMGSPSTETGHTSDETQRSVTLTKPYLIQTTEVTQAQWKAIMENNPAQFQKPEDLNRPIESITWDQVQDFLARLNAKGPEKYRLPTEAEWEYAARAGATGLYFFGDNARFLKDFAWFVETSGDPPMPQPVGKKRANLFGLYDIQGNVSEFVADNYTGEISSAPQVDPVGPAASAHRLYRDCHYAQPAEACRLAARHLIRPDFVLKGQVGFRLVME